MSDEHAGPRNEELNDDDDDQRQRTQLLLTITINVVVAVSCLVRGLLIASISHHGLHWPIHQLNANINPQLGAR